MKRMKLLNGLPLGAIPENGMVCCYELSEEELKQLLGEVQFESYIGHQDTANVLTNLLQRNIECNRASASFSLNEYFVVAAYCGSRLPEGATTLPEGAKFRFFICGIIPKDEFKKVME